jgi:hypothetical protein
MLRRGNYGSTETAARDRALATAEAALTLVRNGLGGRHCKTRKQIDARVAQIRSGQPPLTAADVLKTCKDQRVAGQRHRDLKQTLKVRPVFLHNDDRIAALIAVIGIALLIFGLIEAELRAAPGPGTPLPGIPPEGRAAILTARAALTAFDGLCATYTPGGGLILDRLTPAQPMILACLDIPLPWPEKPC